MSHLHGSDRIAETNKNIQKYLINHWGKLKHSRGTDFATGYLNQDVIDRRKKRNIKDNDARRFVKAKVICEQF